MGLYKESKPGIREDKINNSTSLQPIINVIDRKIKGLEDRIEKLEKLNQNNPTQVLKNEFYEEKIKKLKVAAEKAILKLKQEIKELQIENKELKLKMNHLKEELKRERTRK